MTSVVIHTKHIAPSQNGCYRNVPKIGRAKTKRYREWAAAAGWDMKGKGSVKGPYVLTITIDRAKRHRLSDIMNREKVVSDLLQEHGIIENDNLCERGTVQWGEADGGMVVTVEEYRGNADSEAQE